MASASGHVITKSTETVPGQTDVSTVYEGTVFRKCSARHQVTKTTPLGSRVLQTVLSVILNGYVRARYWDYLVQVTEESAAPMFRESFDKYKMNNGIVYTD